MRRVRGIVFDLGVSSMQLDQMHRGFSYRLHRSHGSGNGDDGDDDDGSPLDMRMDQQSDCRPSAAEIVNNVSESQLCDIIMQYGEETRANARKISRAIVAYRTSKDSETGEFRTFRTTQQLALVVRNALGFGERGYRRTKHGGDHASRTKKDPCARTFQALRIHVNDELSSLSRALESSAKILTHASNGGYLAVVSYHSLEDRIVKQFQVKWTGSNGKVILPSKEEVERNRRCRSAKLRCIEFKHGL